MQQTMQEPVQESVQQTTPEPVLRLMEGTDVDAYRRLTLLALEESADSFENTVEEMSKKDADAWTKDLTQRFGFGCFLGDELIGMIFYHPLRHSKCRHRAVITKFYVDARFRGKKVGFALLEMTKELSKFKNIRQLELTVSAAAKRAIAFYETGGFRQVGCIPNAIDEDGQTHDLLLMLLDVESAA